MFPMVSLEEGNIASSDLLRLLVADIWTNQELEMFARTPGPDVPTRGGGRGEEVKDSCAARSLSQSPEIVVRASIKIELKGQSEAVRAPPPPNPPSSNHHLRPRNEA